MIFFNLQKFKEESMHIRSRRIHSEGVAPEITTKLDSTLRVNKALTVRGAPLHANDLLYTRKKDHGRKQKQTNKNY